jgi:hypothetical protein
MIEPPSKMTKLSTGEASISTSKLIPVVSATLSPSIGGNWPPQVEREDQRLTYLKVLPWMATRPLPAMLMVSCGSLVQAPILGPVVQVTLVVVAAETAHGTSSIRIV